MRKWFLGLAVVLACGSFATADEKVEAVIKKAIDAHGGADNLNKYKAGRFNMKGEMSVMGMDIEFTGKLSYMTPDKYRMEMDATIMGQKLKISQTVKGEVVKGKVEVAGMTIPTPDSEKEDLKLATAMQEAEQLTPLLDSKKFELKAAEDQEVNGAKLTVVLVKIKSLDKEAKFGFDKKTGMLVMTAHKGKSPDGGGEVMEETIHGEYKKVSGVQVATKMTVSHDGKKFMTITASDVEMMEKIDDKEFSTDD